MFFLCFCRSSLQQCKCIVKSSNDITPASDPVFEDLSNDQTGELCFCGTMTTVVNTHLYILCAQSAALLYLFQLFVMYRNCSNKHW